MYGQVEKGTAKGAGICGIILLICGFGSILSGFVWIGIHGYGGYGLWSGIPLLVSGILGVVAWLKLHRGVMVGFLVIVIISIILAVIQAIVSGILYTLFKVLADPGKCYVAGNQCNCGSNGSYDASFCEAWTNLVNSLLAITIFSVIGSIAGLAGSIFGCMGACSSGPIQPGAVVVQQPVVMTTTHQQGYVIQQQGYPQQGYPPQQQGYPQQQQGYPIQQAVYPPAQQVANANPPPQYTEKQ